MFIQIVLIVVVIIEFIVFILIQKEINNTTNKRLSKLEGGN